MPPVKRNYAINWRDGMKLNKDHFIEHDQWILDRIRENTITQLTDFNYGILSWSKDSSLEIMVNIDQNDQMNIKLTDCSAVTKGGRYIEIESQNIQTLQYPLEKLTLEFNIAEATNELFDIILAISPDKSVPVGIPNEEEVPFRHPWLMPEYQVHVVPTKQVNSSQMWNNHITVGRFHIVAREVHFYTDYIPPCTRVDAYPSLLDYYYKFENSVEKITNALAR